MYFLCGTLMFLSSISAALVPETKGKVMENQIRKSGKADVYKLESGKEMFKIEKKFYHFMKTLFFAGFFNLTEIILQGIDIIIFSSNF